MVALISLFNFWHLTTYAAFGVLLLTFSAPESFPVSILSAVALGAAIVAAVHHAENIAHRIGEGLGTLVLALCVTVIEVGLIVTLMKGASADSAATLARDTIFAAVMIITNGIVGLCLILGGLRFREQEFQLQGSNSLLVVLVTLSALVFILPNYTTTTSGPTYNPSQMIFLAVICVLLYLLFVFFQTRSHRSYFEPVPSSESVASKSQIEVSKPEAWMSFASLALALTAVIGLAKSISPLIEEVILTLNAPKTTVGLIIATIVLLPETWAAVNAARANRLQTSLNLALGSGIASIALTVPAVIAFALYDQRSLSLGVGPKDLLFLALTFVVSSITLGSGKSTLLQGAVHAVILVTYFFVSFVP